MENATENMAEPGHGSSQPQDFTAEMPRTDFPLRNSRYKSPVLATLLSLMPGLGQIYVGYYRQGFINVVVVAGLICLLSSYSFEGNLKPFFAFFLVFYWLFNLVDAYRKCAFYNQRVAGLGASDFMDAEQLPGGRGSLAAGVFLIIAGAVALSYTRFGITLEWLEDWWPLGVILFGIYLVVQPIMYYRKQRNQKQD